MPFDNALMVEEETKQKPFRAEAYSPHAYCRLCEFIKQSVVVSRDASLSPRPEKGGFALPRPVKITKTCGVQRGKVDFNPLKFGS